MLKKLIFAFLFVTINSSCPNESLEWQTNCFFFQNETAEFMVAEISCIQKGGHLVSIHDAINDALLAQEGAKHFSQSTVTDFWIGLTGMTPSGNWTWMDGTYLDFTEWAIGEPKNITANNCVALSVNDGFWRTDICFKTKPYICKVDKSFYDLVSTVPTTTTTIKIPTTSKYPIFAYCPYPFIYFEPSHSCYGVGNLTGPMNWESAERYCQAFGAHLSSVHSFEEAMFLAYSYYISNANFWSGAFSNDGGLTWKWSDGTLWDYNPWASGRPSMHQSACGIMWGGQIGDFPCTDINRVLCKKSYK